MSAGSIAGFFNMNEANVFIPKEQRSSYSTPLSPSVIPVSAEALDALADLSKKTNQKKCQRIAAELSNKIKQFTSTLSEENHQIIRSVTFIQSALSMHGAHKQLTVPSRVYADIPFILFAQTEEREAYRKTQKIKPTGRKNNAALFTVSPKP